MVVIKLNVSYKTVVISLSKLNFLVLKQNLRTKTVNLHHSILY